jgi:outer membrane protein assembly factor BamA
VVTAVSSHREEDPATGRITIVFQAESMEPQKLRVELAGYGAMDRQEIIEAAGLPKTVPRGDEATAAPLAKEVQEMYAARGWLDARVDWAVPAEAGPECLRLTIAEGRQYSLGAVTAADGFPDADAFGEQLARFRDQPYTAALVEEVRQLAVGFLSARGYIVDRLALQESRRDGRIDLRLEPDLDGPYHLDNVVVIGSGATVPRELDKMIRFRGDGPLDIQAVYRAESRLYGSGLFEDVVVSSPQVYGKDDTRNVILKLVEAPRYTFGYGFGYQDFEGFRGLLEWTDNNFLGRTLSLGGLFRLSEKKILGQLSVSDQDLFQGRYPLTLSLYGLQEDRVSFKTQRFSLIAQSSIQTGRHTVWLFRLGFENITNYDIQEGLDPGEIERDEQPITLPSVAVSFVRDNRDNLMNATRGRLRSLTVMFAPKIFGADTGFTKVYFQEQHNYRLGEYLVAALSLRAGWILNHSGEADVPISEKFFAGGSSTLRAYETEEAGPLDPVTQEPLGGNALILGNAELRFPIYRLFHGALFYDTGNVFADMSSVNWKDVSQIVGFGLRINTPVVPIRLDFGLSLKDIPNAKDNQFYITIGNPF